MRINPGFFIAKFLKIIDRPALRNCSIDKTASVGAGSNCIEVSMGKYSYMGSHNAVNTTEIGSYCSIASFCAIGGGGHEMTMVSSSPVFLKGRNALNKHFSDFPSITKKTFIGNDVWIGEGVYIKEGVKVGDGAVIGAHSVVTKDIEPYSIVAGAPARHIRYRFDNDIVKKLQELSWWDWPDEKVAQYAQYFNDPERFFAALEGDNL